MKSRPTDNSHFEAKVELRVSCLPEGPLRVLDCYSGTGRLWNEVRRRCPTRDIQVLRIDQRNGLPGIYLKGDNRKYLASMDLDRFNVIDLDAYGVPFDQMEIVFGRPQRLIKTVFVTFIRSGVGQLPYAMLEALGYRRSMISKSPSLFCRNELEKFKAYLAIKGVGEIPECRSIASTTWDSHWVRASARP